MYDLSTRLRVTVKAATMSAGATLWRRGSDSGLFFSGRAISPPALQGCKFTVFICDFAGPSRRASRKPMLPGVASSLPRTGKECDNQT